MKRAIAVSLLLAGMLGLSPPAPAQTPPTPVLPDPSNYMQYGGNISATANSNAKGVDYQVQRQGQAGTVPRSTGKSRCSGMSVQQAAAQFLAAGSALVFHGLQQVDTTPLDANGNVDPNAVEYIVVCDGTPTAYGFYLPGGGPASPATLATAAQSAAGSIPLPGVSIHTSPGAAGLVHLNTWFWTAGYAGRPIVQTRSALGATIEVDATPTSYTWDFGDGSPPVQTKSLGVAWEPAFTPNPSTVDCNFDGTPVTTGEPVIQGAVTHCYTSTSPGFPVTLTFNLAVSYRVNGGPPTALAPIQRTAALSYRVNEVNTIITAR